MNRQASHLRKVEDLGLDLRFNRRRQVILGRNEIAIVIQTAIDESYVLLIDGRQVDGMSLGYEGFEIQ